MNCGVDWIGDIGKVTLVNPDASLFAGKISLHLKKPCNIAAISIGLLCWIYRTETSSFVCVNI